MKDNTVRFLEQSWSGHLKICEIIYNNYNNMLNSLKKSTGKIIEWQ